MFFLKAHPPTSREFEPNNTYWLELTNQQHIPYHVVKSKRAKYIRIKISASSEVKVVLPIRIAEKHAHEFIRQKSAWVVKTISQQVSELDNQYPDLLDLKLLGEVWTVIYNDACETTGNNFTEIAPFTLQITSPQGDWESARKQINHWCKKKAKPTFRSLLEALAEEHGFHFNKLSIRSQKTRWGSCSSDKNISLNSKLLLMPKSVANYVMIHELCHTLEMNHSANFWRLVKDCDSAYMSHRRALKKLGKSISL